MIQKKEIPVYLFTGFLDAGKTTFIQETMEDPAFNDGQKTIMKYKNGIKKTPALFIREKGKKALSMVNYNVKDNCIIIDRVVEQAELRISDTEIVTVKRKG